MKNIIRKILNEEIEGNKSNHYYIPTKSMIGLITENRYKWYKKFLKDNIFIDFPDYIIDDMFRESGDLDYKVIKDMSRDEIINYFNSGDGKRFFDRWGGIQKQKKPKVVEIKWEDLNIPLRKFLKNKMSGVDFNLTDSRERVLKIMKKEPNIGKGINEPIIIKYNEDGKIEDILGGNHRLYAAFELNDFKPIKMNVFIVK